MRPNSVKEVQQIVPAAKHFGLAIHTISCGKNWGYGDACAPKDGQLIIDLGRMNRIVEINEELAYAVIEPGVSQGQLYQELINRNSSLMLDVTGAGPDASIVGNVLQRGFGHTPYGDRTAHSCNYQFVTPDGEVHHTGFGSVTESKVGHVYPYGQGPNEQGMLAQSHHGIVTRMTIWLMPRPAQIAGFGFSTDSDEVLARVVNRIGKLRQSGTINGVVHFANDLRVLSTQSCMKERSNRARPLTSAERATLCKQAGISSWNGLGGLFGSPAVVAAKKRDIKNAFKGVCPVRFFSNRHVQLLNLVADRFPRSVVPEKIRNLTTAITDVYDLLNGKPSPNHLEGAFYRNRPQSGQVIDAGLIWIAPVIPFTGKDANLLISAIEPVAIRYGFDLPVTISPVVPRAAVCITNISYDKENKEERQRATECYTELSTTIESLGYPPYRSAGVKLF